MENFIAYCCMCADLFISFTLLCIKEKRKETVFYCGKKLAHKLYKMFCLSFVWKVRIFMKKSSCKTTMVLFDFQTKVIIQTKPMPEVFVAKLQLIYYSVTNIFIFVFELF